MTDILWQDFLGFHFHFSEGWKGKLVQIAVLQGNIIVMCVTSLSESTEVSYPPLNFQLKLTCKIMFKILLSWGG